MKIGVSLFKKPSGAGWNIGILGCRSLGQCRPFAAQASGGTVLVVSTGMNIVRFCLFLLAVQFASGSAWAKAEGSKSDEILAKIEERLDKVSTSGIPPDLKAKTVDSENAVALPVSSLIRGRARVSTAVIRRELKELKDLLNDGKLKIDKKDNLVLRKDSEGAADWFDSEVEVAKTRDGFIVIGGLERVYAAVLVGAKSVQGKIVYDFTETGRRGAFDMQRTWELLKRADLVRLPQKATELAQKSPGLSGVLKRGKVPPGEEILAELRRNLNQYLDDETRHYEIAEKDRAKTVGKDNRLYLPLQYFIRGQDFISTANVHRKAEVAVESGGVTYDDGRPVLSYADGESSVDIDADVVKTQVAKIPGGKYIIIDGHHEAYAAVLLGSRKVAVEIIADYTRDGRWLPDGTWEDLKKAREWKADEIWDDLKANGKTLLEQPSSELAAQPPNLKGMVDNPNRFLARILSLRVLIENEDKGEPARIIKAQSRGARAPLWIKINKGIPFIEFYLAKIFSEEAGVTYQAEWGESDVPEEVVEDCRNALIKAQSKAAAKTPLERQASDYALLRLPLIHSQEEAERLAKKKKAVERRLMCPILFGMHS